MEDVEAQEVSQKANMKQIYEEYKKDSEKGFDDGFKKQNENLFEKVSFSDNKNKKQN